MKNNGLDLCLKTGCDHKPGKLGVCSEHEQETWNNVVELIKKKLDKVE